MSERDRESETERMSKNHRDREVVSEEKNRESEKEKQREGRREREEEEAVMKCHNLPVILQMASRLLAAFHCSMPKSWWRATVSPLKTAMERDAFTQPVISPTIMFPF